MSALLQYIMSGLRNLDNDIIEGVESNLAERIPEWKQTMVRSLLYILDESKTDKYYYNLE